MQEYFERLEAIIRDLEENIIQGRKDATVPGIEDGMEGKPGVAELTIEAFEILTKLFMGAIKQGTEKAGQRYEQGFYMLPDLLATGEAVGQSCL